MNRTILGIDKLESIVLSNVRIGLVCNHTSYNNNFLHLIDIVRKEGGDVKVVFTPEHGLYGVAYAGEKVISYHDKDYNVDVYSLYGNVRAPPTDLLKDLDFLVFDIQDLGVRWYTYISTLYYVVLSVSKAGIPLIVLDRPNPLNGLDIEGPILEKEFQSFVGIAPIPVRYGLTVGELARYYSEILGLGGDIKILKMDNWRRSYFWPKTNLSWIPPSPNIPSWETALVYSGTCLIEGTNISEGRGTATPFFVLGAPWIKPKELSNELNSLGLSSLYFRPTYFRPYYNKYKFETCGGVYIHILDKSGVKPFISTISILRKIKDLYPKYFEWRKWDEVYSIDRLAGTDKIRRIIEGELELEKYIIKWNKEIRDFRKRVSKVLMYE
ncbi:MAG: DUF1343 domain-containing protein [Thermoproteales archaeon]|nr:DUF1343 domain-containing protein [Thermoproteales archaeon]